ncbi:MAG: 23S rRNA (guanosine(2251)-2'-O)-methyltransferase RlmB [Saccharofermentans sp.]|nr:23S rRNA (guanosine(2251)-2'-O)-methyltransferase RlmB [Saccharofermentans sp.]
MKDNRNYGKGGRKFDRSSGGNNSFKAETPEPSADRLEGRNAVTEAINAGREINKLWILEPSGGQRLDPGLAKILDEANKRKIVVIRSPRNVLDRMSQTHNHQGVIAAVASHEYVEIDDILKKAESEGRKPLLVVLDELKDSYNLGSVLRIADAAGVDGVVIPKHRSIGLDSVVAKASAGAIEYVPVARVTNIAQTLRELKEKHGFWVCGTAAEGSTPYDKADYKGALAIVIGSEGEGMRDSVQKECDFLLSIPMAGTVNSLNAAVAAGIVVFEAVKGRR